ncbi:MAG: type II toxin-antitoxin system ParD family antitoxin [Cyanobacteria bacterium]|nr:type II toxin-antitoxin system ParD family antitoxin [Cyanobacteriota bacterium]
MPSSYIIGEHFEQFIKSQIQQSRYTGASEVIRNGHRALEDREKYRAAKLEALRSGLQQVINSGPGRLSPTCNRFSAPPREHSWPARPSTAPAATPAETTPPPPETHR